MANTAQARKRARQNTKRRQNSASQRSMVRTYLKRVDAAIAAKDYDAATEAYKKAVPVLDRMADKGIIHKNKAARRKSRLNKTIKGSKPNSPPCMYNLAPASFSGLMAGQLSLYLYLHIQHTHKPRLSKRVIQTIK